ncbi:unnamed protein product [Prorocentrum cordatum]|uniref:Uncharacterized protein n=1 Tax=Prorocentrum cordatum TaxID=2364126 RepID=A0ABN9W354_9DINO|nr:unnamed protein product [Polarella glacialis]
MTSGRAVVRAVDVVAGSIDKRDGTAGVGVEYWVQNSFICVGDPDKMQPAERRSKSLPPRALTDWFATLAPPCDEIVEMRRGGGGKRCRRCRGRKGDRCKCLSKAAAAAQKALGSGAERALPVARLRSSVPVA